MIELKNIHSLSDFKRNAKEFIERIKSTQSPMVLTVNGKAEVSGTVKSKPTSEIVNRLILHCVSVLNQELPAKQYKSTVSYLHCCIAEI